jgi:hypothetical protein
MLVPDDNDAAHGRLPFLALIGELKPRRPFPTITTANFIYSYNYNSF